jgi:hypothetical protein
MESTPPPLVGFNNNVRYRGMRFHIQTEDSGVTRPHVITHLFADGGHVIKSVRTDYSEFVSHPERPSLIHKLMRDQHRAMALDLRDGRLDPTIDELTRHSMPASGVSESEAEPEAAAPARDRQGAAFGAQRPAGVAHSNLPADGPLALASEAPPPGTRRSATRSEPAPGAPSELPSSATSASARSSGPGGESATDTPSAPADGAAPPARTPPAHPRGAPASARATLAGLNGNAAPSSSNAGSAVASPELSLTEAHPPSGASTPSSRAAAPASGGAASARSSRPPASDGRPPASSKGRGRSQKKKRGRPSSAPPQTPRSQGGTRKAGRPSATLPGKPSGESIFGATPQESLDDAILSYVTHAKNGPPTRGSK